MKFETKYGPISVSDSTISEYEKLTRGPLSKYCVERVVGELPNRAASSQEKIDQAIIKDGQVEAEEIAEIERMTAAGQRVTISKELEGQMLDIDDDGNFIMTPIDEVKLNLGRTGLSLRTDKDGNLITIRK